MSPAVFFQVASATIGVVVAVAAVVAFLRTNIAKATISLYKEDNDALRTRLDTVEDEERRKGARILTLEAQVHVLEGVVTQAEAINRIERGIRWLLRKEGFDYDTGH